MRSALRFTTLRLLAALAASLIFQPAAQAQTPPLGYYFLATKPLDQGCRLLSFFFLDPALYQELGFGLELLDFQVKQRLVGAPPAPFDIVSQSGVRDIHEQYQGVADLSLPCDKVRKVEVLQASCKIGYHTLSAGGEKEPQLSSFDDCLGPLPRTLSVTVRLGPSNPASDLPVVPQPPFTLVPLWD